MLSVTSITKKLEVVSETFQIIAALCTICLPSVMDDQRQKIFLVKRAHVVHTVILEKLNKTTLWILFEKKDGNSASDQAN